MGHQTHQICGEDKVNLVINALPPNGGSGTYSYSKNSYFQQRSSSVEKRKIEEEILEKFDAKSLAFPSNTIQVADLGSATGPNTFTTLHNVLEAIKHKHQIQCPTTPIPEFHVFFNDLPSNDFNTLFTSLPQDRNYFASGVPGSFYGRLFPKCSIHFAYSTHALHFLNKAPEELRDMNKGRVHYTSANKDVVEAYEGQFGKDAGEFFDARAEEIVPGGMLVMLMQGVPHGMKNSDVINGMMFDYMGSVFMELSKEGLLDESKIDSFNLPFYSPSPEEMRKVIEKNGKFSIERMELKNPAPWLKNLSELVITEWIIHVRAAMERIFTAHFGNDVTHQMFQRLIKQLCDKREVLQTKSWDRTQLLVVLKRKEL